MKYLYSVYKYTLPVYIFHMILMTLDIKKCYQGNVFKKSD